MCLPIESEASNPGSRGQCKMMQNVPTYFGHPIQNSRLKFDGIFLSPQGAILIFMGIIAPTMKASVIEVLLGEYFSVCIWILSESGQERFQDRICNQ